jgi:hypothetical protein
MKRTFKISLIILLFIPVISNAQSKWGKEVWEAYMNSCIGSAKESFGLEKATSYCGCTGAKLEIRYPDATKLASLGEDEILEVATLCLEEIDNATNTNTKVEGPKPPTPPGKTTANKSNLTGATNWSKTGYDSFMKTCVDSAKESLGGEEAAKKYCDCSASKLQVKYPDETKVNVTEAEINKIAEECLGN